MTEIGWEHDDGLCFWDYQPAVGTIGVPLCAEHYHKEHMILMGWDTP